MNAKPGDNPKSLLDDLAAGRTQRLTPDEVARLEGLLNSRPDLADTLGSRPATPGPALKSALEHSAARQAPTADDWERVWGRIDAAHAAPQHQPTRLSRGWWHWWAPLTAAAACLLLGIVWLASPSPPPSPWPLQLATDAEIESLEVYDESTPMIVSTGGDDSIDVIWVLEAEG